VVPGIMGITFRVIAASRQEFAARCGNSGPSFGKECHVLSGRNNRPARGFSGIMGIAFRVKLEIPHQRGLHPGAGAPQLLELALTHFSMEPMVLILSTEPKVPELVTEGSGPAAEGPEPVEGTKEGRKEGKIRCSPQD
jgi:hypothetical protein